MRVAGRLLMVVALVAAFFVAVTTLGGDRRMPAVPTGPLVDSATTLTSISFDPLFDDELTKPATPDARYVILRDDIATGTPDLRAIRAANPNAQILLAKNSAFTLWDPEGDGFAPSGEPRCPFAPVQGSGVDYCVANANESWFLHSASDPETRLTSSGYAGQWAMNPSDPGYREEWAASVLSRLHDADRDGVPDEGPGDRFDGVYMDDVNVRPGHGLAEVGILEAPLTDPAVSLEEAPAYREGMVGFVDAVSAAIHADGFVAMANADANIEDETQRAAALEIAGDLDVYQQERFFRLYVEEADGESPSEVLYSDPPVNGTPSWSDSIGFMQDAQAAGANFAGVTYGRDGGPGNIAAQRFVRASFLLGWDGTDGGALAYRSLDDTKGGPLGLSEWTASIGSPDGGIVPVGVAYARNYSSGLAAVNPDRETEAELDLGGTYRLPDGSCPATTSLDPLEALVLPRCNGKASAP